MFLVTLFFNALVCFASIAETLVTLEGCKAIFRALDPIPLSWKAHTFLGLPTSAEGMLSKLASNSDKFSDGEIFIHLAHWTFFGWDTLGELLRSPCHLAFYAALFVPLLLIFQGLKPKSFNLVRVSY